MRILVSIFFACAICLANAEAFNIDRFDVKANLEQNGTLRVDEAISVTFFEPRRGIFRFIPTEYQTGKGLTRRILITDVRVTDQSNNALKTQITRENENLKIRIGDPDITLPAGTQITYNIHYQAEGVINWFSDATDWVPYAELYWNATGNQWPTEISEANITITFPNTGDGKGLRARVYAGSYGSEDSEALIGLTKTTFGESIQSNCELTATELKCRRTVSLPPYQGMTVVLDLPENLIAKPTLSQKIKTLVLPNLGFGIPLVILFAALLFWLKFGRDPKAGPVVTQFEPPDQLSASQAGTMIDERVDQRDIAAGIVSLAVNGYCKLHISEKSFWSGQNVTIERIEKTTPPRYPLSTFEVALLGKLQDCPGTMIDETDLRTYVAPHMSNFRGQLYQSLVQRNFYRASPESVRTTTVILGLLAVGALAFISVRLSPFRDVIPAIVGAVISVPIAIYFAYQMPRRTPVGSKARQKVLGLEEFIRRAQSEQIRHALEKDHRDAMTAFEELLPYAVAFGLTRQWARAFEGLLTEMPGWYVSPYPDFHWHYFGQNFESATGSVAQAAMTPPRSAGAGGGGSGWGGFSGGGGGFSGGGFGGGGGGSW